MALFGGELKKGKGDNITKGNSENGAAAAAAVEKRAKMSSLLPIAGSCK